MNDTLRPIIVQARPEAGDIFIYKMYHSFCSFTGVLRLLISAAFLVTAILSIGRFEALLTITLFIFGSLNPIVTPIMYWAQACSAARQCITTTYSFTEEKIHINDGKKHADYLWQDFALLVWLKKELFLYSTPTQAFILPRHDIGEAADALQRMILKSAPAERTVIRKIL